MSEAERPGRTGTSNAATRPDFFTLDRLALGLALLVLISFTDVAFGWRSFFTRDFSNFGYPIAYHVQQSYRAGEIPLWNPYNLCGIPFLAQWNTLSLYPGSLIYILLPLPWSLNLFNLLHLYLGGVGMFCLARDWLKDGRAAGVAGVGYAFGGLTVSSLMWPNNIAALGWLPLVLWTGERAALEGGRRIVTAALVLVLQFLAGAPEITALTWAGLAALVLFGQKSREVPLRLRLRRFVIVVAITTGLAAIQLLPFIELLRHSQRGPQFASGEWTLTWPGLGNFLVPLFRTVQDRDAIFFQSSQQWVTSYYPGITVILLSALGIIGARGRQSRLLAGMVILSVMLAFGSHGLLYDWLRHVVPGLGLMRYPIKFIVPAAVVLPLLAAYGTRAWFEQRVKPRSIAWLAGALLLAVLGLALFSQWRPAPGEAVARTWRSALIAAGGVIAMTSLLTWSRRSASASARWLLPLAITAAVFGDLVFANRHINPLVHPQPLTGKVAEFDSRPALGTSRAMVTDAAQKTLDATIFRSPEAAAQIPRQALLLNANLIERVPKLDGFFSLYLPEVTSMIVPLARAPSDPAAQELLDFLSVSHVNQADRPWAWNRRKSWLPMVTLTSGAVPLEPSRKYQPLLSEEFNPREFVFLRPEVVKQVRAGRAGRGNILASRVKSHSIEATVETDGTMLMTVAQANYPGWHATVDGRRVPLWTANYAFQALEVPGGRHEVKLFFRSASFETGAALTAISLIACLIAWCRFPRVPAGNSIRLQAHQTARSE